MQNLQILSVARNRLIELPETIGYLAKLVELRAADNALKTLPASLGMLKKLATLSVENNQLESLPVEIGGAIALVNLDSSGNPLRILPAELSRLKFLRKLRLEDCPLATDFEYPTSNPCPSLKELAARVIVRNQLPILQDTQEELKSYLASARSCSFCGGPYFESSVKRGKFIEKNEYRVPLEYSLCVAHWTTEQERWGRCGRLYFSALTIGTVQDFCTVLPSSRNRTLADRHVSPYFLPVVAFSPSPGNFANLRHYVAIQFDNSSPVYGNIKESVFARASSGRGWTKQPTKTWNADAVRVNIVFAGGAADVEVDV